MEQIKHRYRYPWTDTEVEILREVYDSWPPRYELLPHLKRQTIHSKASRLGLTRQRSLPQPFTDITATEWAYLAGIIDGEGTISMRMHPDGRRGGQRYVMPIVTVANTDVALIKWITDRFGPVNTYVAQPGIASNRSRRKPLYHVRWLRRTLMHELLIGVLPYLIVKKKPAEEMLAWIESKAKWEWPASG